MILVHLSLAASAHIVMDAPTPVTALQKVGPCGNGSHVRGPNVAVYAPGDTITVEWHETIDHPSTYRIAFDEDGDDSFADPADYQDYYTNATVLLDAIPDEADGVYAVQVTLPNVECENCTLQLIQLMLDKPPYAPGSNDIYYQCADLALRAGATTPTTGDTGATTTLTPTTDTEPTTPGGTTTPTTTGPTTDTGSVDTGAGDEGGGCGCTGGGRAPVGLAAPALAALLRRRRRAAQSE